MSLYLNPVEFTNRLRKEWDQYGGLIIAVDIDSTIIPFWGYEMDADFEETRQLIRDCKKNGCTIIINTAAKEDRLEDIKGRLKTLDIEWDYFNQSPPYIQGIGQGGKVYANAYYDDRAGLYQVHTTLKQLLLERQYAGALHHFEGMARQMSKP